MNVIYEILDDLIIKEDPDRLAKSKTEWGEWIEANCKPGKLTEEYLKDLDISREKEILSKYGFELED